MSLSQRLELRQSQQLVMTPQLQQAIKMLQMSNMELGDYIAEELEGNPLLETASGEGRADAEAAPGEFDGQESLHPPKDSTSLDTNLATDIAHDSMTRAEETFDTGMENIYADARDSDIPQKTLEGEVDPGFSYADIGKGGSSGFDDSHMDFDARLTRDLTLREHLEQQLSLSPSLTEIRLITFDLIDQLDESGYMRGDLVEVAERLGADLMQVAEALELLQTFDPVGIGARNLSECLSLQLREMDRLDPAMTALLAHLDLLAKRDIEALLQICAVDLEDLQEMIDEVKRLDPKPGARFDHPIVQTMVPDVYVRENAHMGWTVELNSDTLPKLLINNQYMAEIESTGTQESKNYLSEQQQNASWLLKSIDQRARTILKVASEIVRQQDGFLAYGVTHLRPLNLKDVASVIDMHESTVSRVTSNKYISTPRGVFELKFFFTSSIGNTEGGEAFSAEAIRYKIKELIDKEPDTRPLSDDKIVAILKEEGVNIARRTVAKYREAMNIGSSVHRRRLKTATIAF